MTKSGLTCVRCSSLVLENGIGLKSELNHEMVPFKKDQSNSPLDWLKVENMMQFYNVGFTKPDNGIRYLTCADCDLGPIGVELETGYFIALDRVNFIE